MYKSLARSHLYYCDIIYHIPSRHAQLGVALNALVDKNWKNSIPSSSCCYRFKVHVVQSSLRNWDGNHYLVVAGVGAHNIVIDKTPSYLKNKLPRLRRPLSRQSNGNTFHELRYFPDAITSWNNVITHY